MSNTESSFVHRPYHIVVVLKAKMMEEGQQAWFYHELQQRIAAFQIRAGAEGSVVVEQFVTTPQKLNPWILTLQKRQHAEFKVSDDLLVTYDNTAAFFDLMYDEVWSFGGTSALGADVAARLYRAGLALGRSLGKFKFIPTWIECPPDQSTKPAKETQPCLNNN